MVADLGAGSVDDVSAIWMVGVLWNAIGLVIDEEFGLSEVLEVTGGRLIDGVAFDLGLLIIW